MNFKESDGVLLLRGMLWDLVRFTFAIVALFAGWSFLELARGVETTLFFTLLGVLCLVVGMIAMAKYLKHLGVLLGSALFVVGGWFLFQAIASQVEEPGSWDSVVGSAAFLVFLGLPGLAFASHNRFGLPSREEREQARIRRRHELEAWKSQRADLGAVTELLEKDYAAANTDTERLNIMNEILRKYAVYHKAKGMDARTWSRIAAILESDYEIHRQLSVGGTNYPDTYFSCPGIDWVVNFRGTVRDLLRDEEKKRRQTWSVSEFVWGLAVLLGIVGILSVLMHAGYATLRILVPIVCLNLFYSYAVEPLLIRWKIRREFSTPEVFEIKVDIEGFRVKSSGGVVDKKWSELSKIKYAYRGTTFRWADGARNWLPETVVERISEFRISQRT